MQVPQQIQGTLVVLRQPSIADAEAIWSSYAADALATRYLNWKPVTSLDEVVRGLSMRLERMAADLEWSWLICRHDDGRVMGMIACKPNDLFYEVGYVLGSAFWGKGYATEALSLIKQWCIKECDAFRIWAVCSAENQASIRVLSKCGFRLEGPLTQWPHSNGHVRHDTCLCFAWTRSSLVR